jgi:hypothetical protein
MRRLILLARLALLAALLPAGAAMAQSPTDALCRPIQGEWNSVAGGTDLAAMDREIAKIPSFCAALKIQAEHRRTLVASRLRQSQASAAAAQAAREKTSRDEAAHEQAARDEAAREQSARDQAARDEAAREQAVRDQAPDDAAFAVAKAADTVSAYDAYLSAYPKGRHVDEAKAATANGARLDGATGRLFQYVSAPGITWDQAAAGASSMRSNGRLGHLATIESQAELEFIENHVIPGGTAVANIYVGGRRLAGTAATWVWATGPSDGQIFWKNGPVADSFAPWDPEYALGPNAPTGPKSGAKPVLYLNQWFRPFLSSATGRAVTGVPFGGDSGYLVEF